MPKKGAKVENDEQIFDSFMEFLRSDLWLIPLSQFLEQRSIVFEREPDLSVVPSTAECYQGVHREFGEMVSDLVNAHCMDAGLSREQVMGALKARDKARGLTQKERMLLEPILAAQDFDVFVPMMMRKNIELQLQALKMIEHIKGLVPNSLTLGQEDAELWESLFGEEESDRLILISVLKQSKEEWEKDQRMRQDWQAQMEAAIRESLTEKSHLEELRRREQGLLENALSKAENNFNFEFTKMAIGEGEGRAENRAGRGEEEEGLLLNVTGPRVEVQLKGEKPVERSERTRVATNEKLASKPGTSSAAEKVAVLEIGPKEREKVRRTASNQGGGEEAGKGKEKESAETGEKPGKADTKGKRLSLGQVHVPAKGVGLKEEKAEKGDLAYRSLLRDKAGIPEEALQSRMRYLREQRDKLLQKKSREREKQLMEAAKLIDGSRPKTAQAARGLMEQGIAGDLEERRRIVAKIRAEVIDRKQQPGANEEEEEGQK